MFIHSSFACGIMMACLGLVQPPLPAASQNDAGIIDLETDLLIVGATESGWAAAIQACRSGVGAQGILEQVFRRLDRFVGADRPLEDDASLVVLKVREEVMLPSLPS